MSSRRRHTKSSSRKRFPRPHVNADPADTPSIAKGIGGGSQGRLNAHCAEGASSHPATSSSLLNGPGLLYDSNREESRRSSRSNLGGNSLSTPTGSSPPPLAPVPPERYQRRPKKPKKTRTGVYETDLEFKPDPLSMDEESDERATGKKRKRLPRSRKGARNRRNKNVSARRTKRQTRSRTPQRQTRSRTTQLQTRSRTRLAKRRSADRESEPKPQCDPSLEPPPQKRRRLSSPPRDFRVQPKPDERFSLDSTSSTSSTSGGSFAGVGEFQFIQRVDLCFADVMMKDPPPTTVYGPDRTGPLGRISLRKMINPDNVMKVGEVIITCPGEVFMAPWDYVPQCYYYPPPPPPPCSYSPYSVPFVFGGN